jgi:hypothetical protein
MNNRTSGIMVILNRTNVHLGFCVLVIGVN